MKPAKFWHVLKDNLVKCDLCPKGCVIPDQGVGDCRVRKNIGGKLYSLVYGKVIAAHLDPIEKKPLFHFYPGSYAYSIATPGCNLHCVFCQNWEISQEFVLPDWEVEPEFIVEKALEMNAHGIAYTYTEPTIFIEFALDVAKLAKKNKLYNVWISNGMINPEPLKEIAKYLDAANIDLKGDAGFYRTYAKGVGDEPVKRTIKLLHDLGVWVEVTTLVIPTLNDDVELIRRISSFLASISKDVPLHLTRFHPDYKLRNLPLTPVETLEKLWSVARQNLNYVYIGNVFGHEKESTYCPRCGAPLIKRVGFEVLRVNLEEKNGKYYCRNCGEEIKIVGKILA